MRMRAFVVGGTLLAVTSQTLAVELPSQIRYLYEESAEFGCKITDRAVQILDLQGDGTKFYIVDTSKISCKKTAWCGSGGCSLYIYVKKFNSYKEIFGNNIQTHFFRKAKKGYELFVEYKLIGTARYHFDSGCAKELGKNNEPFC